MGKEESERISQANLGEGVFKGEIGLRAGCGAQEDAEEDEHQASPHGVRQLMAEALAFLYAAVDGIRKSDADQKGEPRLDGVVESHASPFNVSLIEGEDTPEEAVGKSAGHAGETHDLAHHQQHHEAAIGVDSNIADGRRHGGMAPRIRLDLMNVRGDRGLHSFSPVDSKLCALKSGLRAKNAPDTGFRKVAQAICSRPYKSSGHVWRKYNRAA